MMRIKQVAGYSGYVIAFILATAAHAQSPSTATGPTFADVVNNSIVPFFNGAVIPLLYAIAFLVMIFGLVRYFFTGGEENRIKGKKFLVWGLVGMVVIFSLWGIVNLFLSIIPT